LTECRCAAANEKSAREPRREPEIFHESDELTNFAAEAQHKVHECHCSEKGERPPVVKGETTYRSPEFTQCKRGKSKDFY